MNMSLRELMICKQKNRKILLISVWTVTLNELYLSQCAQTGVQVRMEERGDVLTATMETPHWAGGSECTSQFCCSGYSPLLQQPNPLFVSVLVMKTLGARRRAMAPKTQCVCACLRHCGEETLWIHVCLFVYITVFWTGIITEEIYTRN